MQEDEQQRQQTLAIIYSKKAELQTNVTALNKNTNQHLEDLGDND